MRGPKRFDESIRLPAPGGLITRISSPPDDPLAVVIKVGRANAGQIPAALADRLGARPGAPWTDDLRSGVLAALAADKARTHAIRTASARAVSAKQLRDRLTARGTPRPAADAIVAELAAKGLVSDENFAENFAERAAGRPIGESLVAIKLMQRGIHATLARKAAKAAFLDAGIDPARSALELARRRIRTLRSGQDPRAAQKRIYAFLARRGFDPETCSKAVRAAFASPDKAD